MKIKFTLNGKETGGDWPAEKRLLDVIREDLGLTGAKEGCGEGECGACSVLMDGKIVNSCLVPLGQTEGARIVTPEGLKESPRGRALLDAFAQAGAVQCGFCTPGMMMAAEALLSRNPKPDEQTVREAISGNLCRCTGYDKIVLAILLAAEKGGGLW